MAEAHGAKLSADLLARLADRSASGPVLVTHLRARICGDCTQTVRYASAQARMRIVGRRQPVDQAVEQLWQHGWRARWQAVRRCHNEDAHRLATAAAVWAADLKGRGLLAPRLHVVWADMGDEGCPRGLAEPPWP